MFEWLAANGTLVSAISDAVTAFIAVIAAFIAAITIRASRRSQREATAKELWHAYEKMAFENPMFASPFEHSEIKFDYQTKKITMDGEHTNDPNELRLRFESYEWYVSMLLNVCEEIHALKLNKDWMSSMSTQINFHKQYLQSPIGETYLKDKEHYNKEFMKFVRASLA